jgi:hypothetical protein
VGSFVEKDHFSLSVAFPFKNWMLGLRSWNWKGKEKKEGRKLPKLS